jgi:chromosomal replication initiation ATPase DnaA
VSNEVKNTPPLPIKPAPTYAVQDFFVSKCNEDAYNLVMQSLSEWPNNRLLLIGEGGSGKSHLAAIWQQTNNGVKWIYSPQIFSSGVLQTEMLFGDARKNVGSFVQYQILDDIDLDSSDEYELWLCGVINHAMHNGIRLLMTASEVPKFRLQDLSSRINGTFKVNISQPDDGIISVIVRKYFYDKQLNITEEAILYIMRHIVRQKGGFRLIRDIVNAVDLATIKPRSRAKSVSMNSVRQVLRCVK